MLALTELFMFAAHYRYLGRKQPDDDDSVPTPTLTYLLRPVYSHKANRSCQNYPSNLSDIPIDSNLALVKFDIGRDDGKTVLGVVMTCKMNNE